MQAQDHSSFVSLTVKFWNKKTFYRSPIIDSFKIILTRVAQKEKSFSRQNYFRRHEKLAITDWNRFIISDPVAIQSA